MSEIMTLRKKVRVSGGTSAFVTESVQASYVLPTLAYDAKESIFYNADKTIGFAIQCQPISGVNDHVESAIDGMLSLDWIDDSMLSFFMFKSPDIQEFIDNMWSLRRNNRQDRMSRDIISERESFLQKHTRVPLKAGNHFKRIHDTKITVTYKVPYKGDLPSQKLLEKVSILKEQAVGSLMTLGMHPEVMEGRHYIRLMQTLFNWSEDALWRQVAHTKHDVNKEISKQIVDCNNPIDITTDYLTLGLKEDGEPLKYVRTMSAKDLPEVMFVGDTMQFIGEVARQPKPIKDNYAISVNVYFPASEVHSKKLAVKAQAARSQAFSGLTRMVPTLGEKAKGFDILTRSMEKFRVCQVATTAIVFSDTKEDLMHTCQSFKTSMKTAGYAFMDDKLKYWPTFQNSLPLCADIHAVNSLGYYKSMTTEHAKALVPLFGEWKGHYGQPHMNLIGRNGQLMGWTLHSANAGHFITTAGTGGGKSFNTNEIVSSYLTEGAYAWIIDQGGSYKNICKVWGGNYIDFKLDEDGNAPYSFNPFASIIDYDEEKEALFTILRSMVYWESAPNDEELAVLEKAINQIWAIHQQRGSVTLLAKELAEMPNKIANKQSQILHRFTEDGEYGTWFAGNKPLAFTGRFNVLELERVNKYSEQVRTILLMTMIDNIKAAMYGMDKNIRKLMFVDEAWSSLRSPKVASFLEVGYREFRKYNGLIGIITQTAGELDKGESTQVMITQALNKLVLMQEPYGVKQMREMQYLGDDDYTYALVKSVFTDSETPNGKFSEIYINSRGGQGVGRLIVPKVTQVMYSTTPEDVQYIKQRQQDGKTIMEAIHELAEKVA